MKKCATNLVATFLAILGLIPATASAVQPTADEMAKTHAWVADALGEKAAAAGQLPFSFVYDGRPAKDLMKDWSFQRTVAKLDDQRSQVTLIGRDPKTGLEVRCVAVEYADFPTVEWTVFFKNTGSADTPILEKVLALDATLLGEKDEKVDLHHQPGSLCVAGEYEPLETVVVGEPMRIATSGGRPTNTNLPYFNLAQGDRGAIVVIGWPGQWSAAFARDGKGVRIQTGQELTHFKLLPGEEVRGPLMAVQFYQGDWIRGQNLWRRWMVAHSLPRSGGQLPPPLNTPCSSHQFGEMIHANEANQKQFIDRYVEEGLKPDYWWMDAGWYVNDGTWVNTGTWEVDRKRFPNGLRAVSDHAHAKGLKTIVWFEPERVTPNSWLAENHPEWLLYPKKGDQAEQHRTGHLNLGNPEAWNWLVNHIDRLIVDEGIDLYRQDFNTEPLQSWRDNDTEDRQGITEIKYVTGYLAYWDELRRRHPNMLIDSCASGGRRNDLETLRRSVPFVRSDYLFEPIGQQGHMYGISLWMPYNGTGSCDRTSILNSKIFKPTWVPAGGTLESEAYLFRSVMTLHLTPCYDVREPGLDYAELRRLWGQWRQVAPNYYGDYYPLTPYSLARDVWMAWQFDCPEKGQGMVQAFRRGECPTESIVVKLQGLDPQATYVVKDVDAPQPRRVAGKELVEQGLAVTLAERSAAAVVTYQKED